MSRHKSIFFIVLWCVLIVSVPFFMIFGRKKDYSESERRVLESMPELSAENVMSGKFMSDFETYAADHMPFRDGFRGIKSFCKLKLFVQSDVNGLYLKDGYIGKVESKLNPEMLEHAAEKFSYLHENYFSGKDMKIYLSIVPDKHYFLSADKSRASMDYGELVETIKSRTDYMEYIDIFPLLETSDYYRTDTHWRQEKIFDVAQEIARKMNVEFDVQYVQNRLDIPFYGVYYGQLSLPVKPDELFYMTSDTLESCVVTSYDTGVPVEKDVYDMEKAYGKDTYEMFLSGSDALIEIENPNADTKRELIVFRDSFASSITPYLVEGYSKITLVDIRYIQSSMLDKFIDFDNQDVLFLYSTLILNNSLSLK